MKKTMLKKILNTKIGGLIFKTMIAPPILGFGLIGATMIWWNEKR